MYAIRSYYVDRGGRGGRVINIASIFGHQGSSLFRVSSYAASKGGVENLTRQLAVEWAGRDITVNAIAPAWFPTEMTGESLDKGDIAARMGSATPLNRMGRPGELETACLFLASPASRITSYNVCYTKLLRFLKAGRQAAALKK